METGVCLTCGAEEVEVDDDGKCPDCDGEKGHTEHDEEPAE